MIRAWGCGRETEGVLRSFLTRSRWVIISILALSTVSFVDVADAQTDLNQESFQRARLFLSRFMDSACLNNERCQSWLKEMKLDSEDVARALEQVGEALGARNKLRDQIARLKGDRLQAERDTEAVRQTLSSLTRDAVENALAILGAHHFGFQARSPADLLSQQIKDPAARFSCGDQQVIVTIFGYFIYDQDIDLTKGEKKFRLLFQPFVFASGGSLGQAIDSYMNKTPLSLEPRLKIAARSVEITPSSQPRKLLQVAKPTEWLWDVKPPRLSTATESDGAVTMLVTSPDGPQDIPSLMVKVKLSPWWSWFSWVVEKGLLNPVAWCMIIVFAGIVYRKGLRAAGRSLWELIKRQSGLDDQAGDKK